jgi:hypothetical protein
MTGHFIGTAAGTPNINTYVIIIVWLVLFQIGNENRTINIYIFKALCARNKEKS